MVISRIEPMSLAKIYGAFSAVAGLVIGAPIILITGMVTESLSQSTGAPGLDLGPMFGWTAVIWMPLFYGIFGFVFAFIFAALYNWFAGVFGGIEIELEADEE